MRDRILIVTLCAVLFLRVGPQAPAAETAAAPSVESSAAVQAEPAQAAQPGTRYVEWFSDKGRVFPALLTDPREAQFRLGFGHTTGGETLWDFGFGADLALLRTKELSGAETSLSVRGLVEPRFDFRDSSFKLKNTDFFGGVAYGWARGPRAYEVLFYHTSSHLGDQFIEETGRQRIDFSREALRFLISHRFDRLRLYGGPSFVTRKTPRSIDGRVIAQGGAEYRFNAGNVPMYAGLDLQSKEENDWAVNATAQIGVELGNPENVKNRHRIFLEFFTGHSNMGQFFNETESYVLLGVGYTFK